jgi:hypothetical protein
MARKVWNLLLASAFCGYIVIDLLIIVSWATRRVGISHGWPILILSSLAAWRCFLALQKRTTTPQEQEVPHQKQRDH